MRSPMLDYYVRSSRMGPHREGQELQLEPGAHGAALLLPPTTINA